MTIEQKQLTNNNFGLKYQRYQRMKDTKDNTNFGLKLKKIFELQNKRNEGYQRYYSIKEKKIRNLKR